MAVVECPACQARFSVNLDRELASAGGTFSMKVPCATCDQWVRLPECESIPAPGGLPSHIREAMKQQSRLLASDDPTPTTFRAGVPSPPLAYAAAPRKGHAGVPSGGTVSRELLRAIAGHQRALIFCVLFKVILALLSFVSRDLGALVGIGTLILGIASLVLIILLAVKLGEVKGGKGRIIAFGVVCGVLSIIPLLGLIPLLLVNARATRTLKDNGIAVGLFGADMS